MKRDGGKGGGRGKGRGKGRTEREIERGGRGVRGGLGRQLKYVVLESIITMMSGPGMIRYRSASSQTKSPVFLLGGSSSPGGGRHSVKLFHASKFLNLSSLAF